MDQTDRYRTAEFIEDAAVQIAERLNAYPTMREQYIWSKVRDPFGRHPDDG
jgi:hypothetical protein